MRRILALMALMLISACSIESITEAPDIREDIDEPPKPEDIVELPTNITSQNTTNTTEPTQEEPPSPEDIIIDTSETPLANVLEQKTAYILVKSRTVSPKILTVEQGTMVIWYHMDKKQESDKVKHKFKIIDVNYNFPIIMFGQKVNYTFNESGNYQYFDIILKEWDTLRGAIVVKESLSEGEQAELEMQTLDALEEIQSLPSE